MTCVGGDGLGLLVCLGCGVHWCRKLIWFESKVQHHIVGPSALVPVEEGPTQLFHLASAIDWFSRELPHTQFMATQVFAVAPVKQACDHCGCTALEAKFECRWMGVCCDGE